MYKYNSFFCIELKFCNLAKPSKRTFVGLMLCIFPFSETIVLCYLSKKALFYISFCFLLNFASSRRINLVPVTPLWPKGKEANQIF